MSSDTVILQEETQTKLTLFILDNSISSLNFPFARRFLWKNDSLKRQIMEGDLSWCQRLSIGVFQNMLSSCQTMMQVHLWKLLCHSKFGFGFTIMGE